MSQSQKEHIIKKYPNRRLYDTQTSMYINMSDVKQMVLVHDVFRVIDVKTQEDLTRSIMLQIILEEENEGISLFSTEMLAQIIRSYGHVMQGMLGSYLEKNMQAFADIQNDLVADGEKSEMQNNIDGEIWQQLLAIQTPMMQSMMSTYIKQSREMFIQMRDVMASQTAVLFQNLSGSTHIKPELLDLNVSKAAKTSKATRVAKTTTAAKTSKLPKIAKSTKPEKSD